MKIPSEVWNLATTGLEGMRQHPDHLYDWKVRREIYRLSHTLIPEYGERIHGWLAIFAAQKVVQIFDNAFPEIDLPVKCLSMALQVMEGKAHRTAEEPAHLIEEGYHTTGTLYLYFPKMGFNQDYAAGAAYMALKEVVYPIGSLEHIEHLAKGRYPSGETIMSFGGTEPGAVWETGDSFTDLDIGQLDASDTASAAFMAFACYKTKRKINRKKASEFWEWWVQEALTEAWKRG